MEHKLSPPSLPPSPSASCLSFSVFLCVAGRAYCWERGVGRVWARSQIIRPQESLVIYKSFINVWSEAWGCNDEIGTSQGLRSFICTANALSRKFETKIPRKETAWRHSQFYIHVSVSDLDIPAIGTQTQQADRSWEYGSLIHECRNWERGRAVSFLGIHVSTFRCSVEDVNRY